MTTNTPISFDEIRAGDTIRVEHAVQDLQISNTGTATRRDPFTDDWLTASGLVLTYHKRHIQKYFLLDRPKPKLPTEKGSVIRIKTDVSTCEINKLAMLDSDGDWVIVANVGIEYFLPEHILDWNSVTIIDVEE